jgi:hypothetical protein
VRSYPSAANKCSAASTTRPRYIEVFALRALAVAWDKGSAQ